MKLTTKLIRQIIKEELNEEMDIDGRMQLVAKLRNIILKELDMNERHIDRYSGTEFDNLMLQIVDLSKSNLD